MIVSVDRFYYILILLYFSIGPLARIQMELFLVTPGYYWGGCVVVCVCVYNFFGYWCVSLPVINRSLTNTNLPL